MRPRPAALLTPPSPTPAFPQNVANPCICHTSENSPVTPIIATDPKCAPVSLVFATLATLSPLLHFIFFSFDRGRTTLQMWPFVFKQLQDAPPATLLFSCFCMVAPGVGRSPLLARHSLQVPEHLPF